VISGAISAGPSKSRTAFGAKQDAVVLAAAPKILLANEPTSEVDVGQGSRFWNSLKSTAGIDGAVVVVSHSAALAPFGSQTKR